MLSHFSEWLDIIDQRPTYLLPFAAALLARTGV